MGVSGQRHAPVMLYPPGKEPPVLLGQEAGLASEPVWTQRLEEKPSCGLVRGVPLHGIRFAVNLY
jgi:hypothetical protein